MKWKVVTLGEVCHKGTSGIAQKDLADKSGEYPIYGASGLIQHVDFYHQERSCIAVVKDGAGIGRAMILPPKSSVIGTMQYLIPEASIDVRYLYYAVVQMNLAKYYAGATIPHIYFKDYQKEKLPLPPIEIQHQIAETLDHVTHLTELCSRMTDKLDLLVKSRFIEMFGDETNSKGLPLVKIGEVADIQVGVVIKPAQYYTDQTQGTKAFRSLNIGEMYIKNTDWVYFSDEGNTKNAKSILHENDVVIVRSGAPGTSCVITKEYDGCNAIDIIIAHPDFSKVSADYLCAFTNFPHGKNQIIAGTGGAAQQHFNVGKYKEMTLYLPDLKEQQKFEHFVRQVDQSRSAVRQIRQKAETLKNALMQKYFTQI